MSTAHTFIDSQLRLMVNNLDAFTAKLGVQTLGEKNGLSSFLFHSLKKTQKSRPTLYPQENLTIELFDNFIGKMLDMNYTFVGPDEVHNGSLSPEKKYGLITFDDGYFNNTWCLDVLKKYNVPAVFFITTNWIQQNEKMWGDVIFQERTKQGCSRIQIDKEIISLVPQKISQIKDYITREFGLNSFIPQGDEDRPMTETELRQFSSNPLVFIGNHTHNHECLSNLTPDEIEKELTMCQKILGHNLGYKPTILAYPYGRASNEVINKSKELNFKLGFSVVNTKTKLPISSDAYLNLSRFQPMARNDAFNFDLLRTPFQFKYELTKALQNTRRLFG